MRVKKMGVVYEPENKSVQVVREMAVNYDGDFRTPDSIVQAMNDLFMASHLPDEHVWVIGFDARMHCRGIFEVSHGSACSSMVPIREIMRDLLLIDATGFVMVHNHPSGLSNPSNDDIETTKILKKSSDLLWIKFWDHVIIGTEGYYSFLEADKSKNSFGKSLL